jgi:putative hemolysin
MSYRELAEAGDEEIATRHVRGRVYLLRGYRTGAGEPSRPFPAVPVTLHAPEPIGPPIPGVLAEIEALEKRGKRLVENDAYAVYGEVGRRIPLLVCEIGRLRELTFREVKEGTGKRVDSDEFDRSYTHLILWHKQSASVAGGYRLAWTTDVAESKRGRGMYTSKLFRYAPEFFSRLGPAVEVGRSFITRQHQREYDPLLLLWQAIGRCVAVRPDSPVLFGTVSISTAYPQAARELIVEFLREKRFREDLAPFVSPRRAFRPHLLQKHEMSSIIQCLREIDDLPIHDLGPLEGVPVLLRQYLRLGGKVAGFNVDSQFSGVLDALLIVDLRQTPRKLLTRYMGARACEEFLRYAQPLP